LGWKSRIEGFTTERPENTEGVINRKETLELCDLGGKSCCSFSTKFLSWLLTQQISLEKDEALSKDRSIN
jgi:hypothetical protein